MQIKIIIVLAIDETNLDKKFSHLWTVVGNTPMIAILYSYQGNTKTIERSANIVT
ncbi:MAG: hypothetical protein M3N30_03265 [Bacteroidota bacterium]|nr:hypothetical protein [Bacteroidota bacterium]